MQKKLGRLFSVIVIFIIIVIAQPLPFQMAGAYDAASAKSYLESRQGNPWVTMGLVAAGSNNISSDYLKNISGTTAIEYEAPILAITSLNLDPKTFGNVDYIGKLKTYFSGGQIGDADTLNDDIFGILALRSAGLPASDPVISQAKDFLLASQKPNGGFGFTVSSSPDSNTTAAAILALVSAGVPKADSHIQNALDFLKTAQNGDGGFTYDPASSYGTASDSSSTAWVIWALNALSVSSDSWAKSGHTPTEYINGNQDGSGYFKYQQGTGEDSFSGITTAYAAIALAGKTLPLAIHQPAQNIPVVDFRIEGKDAPVCEGQVAAANALDAVKNASATCGFTYDIKTLSFGPYLNQINQDTAAGAIGWLYLVNYNSPSVGASEYALKDGDDVLWYYGDYTWLPLRLSLSAAETGHNQTAQATVEGFGNGQWSPVAGSQVFFGVSSALSDPAGKADITAPDGYYKIYAQKNGYVRSENHLLKVGQPAASSLSLNAEFSGGQVQGTSTPPQTGTVSLTIDASSLDFGQVSPGTQKDKNVNITNNSTGVIRVESTVSGDSLFTNSLLVNNAYWQNFQLLMPANHNQTIPVKLKVSDTFSGASGQKSGQLVFWATSQ